MARPLIAFRGLQSRIVFFFAILLVLVQGIALVLVDAVNLRNARAKTEQDLAVGEHLFRRLIEQNDRQLTQAAEVLSLDFGFREAVATRDLETIRSVLMNHGSRIRADVMGLVSLDRRVIADTSGTLKPGDPYPFSWLLDGGETDGQSVGIVTIGGRAYELGVVPVRAPVPIAWAVIGFVVDDRMAKDLQSLSGLHVSFLARNSSNDWQTLASTLPRDLEPELRTAVMQRFRTTDQNAAMELGGEQYETLVMPLQHTGDNVIVAVLQRSLEEALAPFRRLGTTLVLLAIGSLLVSIFGSIVIARGITRPVGILTALTKRMEEGDYSQPVEIASDNEIGDLARRFNLMREGIAAREEQILRLAYRDNLTDLPNRIAFGERLTAAIAAAKQSGVALAVLIMDLNRFKYINDALGHSVGDQVLQQAAKRLVAFTRDSDLIARLGGDEFAVLVVGADVDQGARLAERIDHAFEAPIVIGNQSLDVHISVGVACYPTHGEDGQTLMRHADTAMYGAKRAHCGVMVYERRTHQQREEHLSLLTSLRRAIERGELRLVYQPKVALSTGVVTGVEGLVRWLHPDRGPVLPSEFIPFAEQTGFIKVLTAWVLDTAIAQCARWRNCGVSLTVSVNISTLDLLDHNLIEMVTGMLKRYDVPPDDLCLEITESGLMQDAEHAIEVVNRLHAAGICCSIDDFGTGYSSLAYIKLLQVAEMKIDRSFVQNIVNDPRDSAIVLSMIELGHNLGLSVVAEGVEDKASLARLQALGCDQVQGYLIAKPLEAEAVAGWLAARTVTSYLTSTL